MARVHVEHQKEGVIIWFRCHCLEETMVMSWLMPAVPDVELRSSPMG